MIEKIKEALKIINYPIGIDEDFDKECDSAFHRFLDRLLNVFYFCFFVFACTSVYFFVTHELMK